MFVDFIQNGRGHGAIGEQLAGVHFDPYLLRPFVHNGRRYVLQQTGKKFTEGMDVPIIKPVPVETLMRKGIYSPVFNAATLTKDAWIELDRSVVKATRNRLRAWTDLEMASPRGGFNGMAKMTLEYQAMSDPGEAQVYMDALSDGRSDRPLFNLKSVPLPITHSDFWFSQREIAVSRNSGTPLDTTMAEAGARRVAEMIEKTLIGTETGATYGTNTNEHTGTSRVFGYTNFTYRVTKTDLTAPTGSNPEAVMTDILEMIETMTGNGFYGPFILYHSTGYSRYLNDDYFRTGSTSAVRTLRERLMEIEGIQDIRRLDYLTSGYQLILVQMTSDVAQAINGMDITTVQWDGLGGLKQMFKIMAIKVPLLKSPYNGTAGIIHGTTS
jgi:uncharacterized linocin/CFP29 family protein